MKAGFYHRYVVGFFHIVLNKSTALTCYRSEEERLPVQRADVQSAPSKQAFATYVLHINAEAD
jgi:hypothetical protein